MCSTRRINRLKQMSVRQFERIRSFELDQHISRHHVSESGLTYNDIEEKIDRVGNCASLVEMAETWENGTDGPEQVLKVTNANYCKQPHLCPMCADRMQTRRRARFDNHIRDQVALYDTTRQRERTQGDQFDRKNADNRFAYLVTYTVADGPDLIERLGHLKESKRAFMKMGQRRDGRRSGGEARKIVAALSTTEIKRGETSNLWHVHCHDLVFTKERIDYVTFDDDKYSALKELYGDERIPKSELLNIALDTVMFQGKQVPINKISREWLAATGGDSLSIDVAPITHIPKKCKDKKRRKLLSMNFVDSVCIQAAEALKYPVKPTDLSPEDSIHVIESTFNRRLVASYGAFYGIAGDILEDNSIPDDAGRWVLQWNGKSEYGNPIPGTIREVIEADLAEIEKSVRSQCGRITGEYRRSRRSLLDRRSLIGNDLGKILDYEKQGYRQRINHAWMIFRQAVGYTRRQNEAGGGYTQLQAASGHWFPVFDRCDLYAEAFS